MRRSPLSSANVPPVEPEGQIDVAGIAAAMWRQRRWIIGPVLIVAAISAVGVNVVTPRYKSEARVLIENRETAYNRPEGDRSADRDRPLLDPEAVQSQVQLMLSRDLARKVVRELKLDDRREFNPNAGGTLIDGLLDLLGLLRKGERPFDERVLERYYDRISVFQIERSRVIAVEFRSYDSELAAKVANAVAEGYLVVQQAAKQEAMRQASQWLAREIDQLRARVAEAEAKVEEFRAKSNLYVGSNNNPLSAQQLAELNSQTVLARSQRAEAEAKARLIRQMLQSGQPIESSEIVNSELIRRLNEQRVILRAQLAEQSSTLLPQHPRIKELKAQIADLEAQIRAEAGKLVRSLENDAKIAAARVETLNATFEQVKRQAGSLGGQDVQLRALEREAKAQRDLLESYLSRYRDATARETPDAVLPDARIVSRAVPSPYPYFPKKLPIIALASLAAFVVAASLVGAGELLRDNGRYVEEPFDLARDGNFAVPPQPVPIPNGKPQPAVVEAQDPPREQVTQAAPPPAAEKPSVSEPEPNSAVLRQQRIAEIADYVRELGRGIVVVTPASNDAPWAKIAVDVARELGKSSASVLLLDLQPPAESPLVEDRRTAGFSELLAGKATFAEVIHRDPHSNIHVIARGRGSRSTATLIAAKKLAIVFGALAQTYDHVVAAAPAILRVEGAERIATFSRGVIVVTTEGGEGAGTAASESLAARGFRNIAVVSVEPRPPAPASNRNAA